MKRPIIASSDDGWVVFYPFSEVGSVLQPYFKGAGASISIDPLADLLTDLSFETAILGVGVMVTFPLVLIFTTWVDPGGRCVDWLRSKYRTGMAYEPADAEPSVGFGIGDPPTGEHVFYSGQPTGSVESGWDSDWRVRLARAIERLN